MKKAVVLSNYEFLKKFNTECKCLKFLEKNLWKKGIKCGYCDSKRVSKKNKKTGFYQCKDCRKKFNVRTNTIFHKSKLPLSKWLYAVYLTQTGRTGISSSELSKKLGITQKSSWFMWHRIREVCKEDGVFLSGKVQVDETWFGGLSKNKHKSKVKKEKSWKVSKAMVQGMRAGNQVKTKVIEKAIKKNYKAI